MSLSFVLTVPSAPPQDVSANVSTVSPLIVVSWTPPPKNGRNGPLSDMYYVIQYSIIGNSVSTVTVRSGALQYTLINLSYCKEYLLRVAAANTNGTGPYSSNIIKSTTGLGEFCVYSVCLCRVCTVYVTCVLSMSPVYCLCHLCTVYVTCVLSMSRVYCLCHLCTVYVTCVLSMSPVYCLCHLCTVFVTCVLSMSHVYCLCHVCSVYVTCVLSLSHVYCLCHVCSVYVTCVPSMSRVFRLCHVCTVYVTCVPSMSRVYCLCHVCSVYVTCVLSMSRVLCLSCVFRVCHMDRNH